MSINGEFMQENKDDFFLEDDFRLDKLNEECGVFGIFNRKECNAAHATYYALYALQHRGQESCGIAVNADENLMFHRDMGLVPEIFTEKILNKLEGNVSIGHVRYSTERENIRENSQPMVIKYKNGKLALAHNGNLVNSNELREKFEEEGVIFQSTIDSEIILNLISRHRVSSSGIEEALEKTMQEIKGSYALVILSPRKLIGVRDPLGIRPLCIGITEDGSHVLSSETCALDAVGATFLRDVNPGEIVVISEEGLKSIQTKVPKESKLCIFEHIYFARPDSYIDGASVYRARIEAGKRLAIEHPADADLVIGVPDSGLTAALGFSQQSGIPYGMGILKNRYVGRTFIQPGEGQREKFVKIKLNAIRDVVNGKRLVMVDDSIVRGTTSRRIVQMLKDAGATEVHIRVSSPPVKYPCYFGIDISSKSQLVAANYSTDAICEMIGADSLGYLSVEGLLKTPLDSKCGFCAACFEGNYPMEVPEGANTSSCG